MPHVDTNAPLVTNSDAAMWRQDHASACRYIEALLAEKIKLLAAKNVTITMPPPTETEMVKALTEQMQSWHVEAERRKSQIARLHEELAEKEASIEALLEERETWAPVMEAAKTWYESGRAKICLAEPHCNGAWERYEAAHERLVAAIAAALKEGNADG